MSVLDRLRARRAGSTRSDYADAERAPRQDVERDREHAAEGAPRRSAGDGAGAVAAEHEVRAAQREEYGGLNWGASFFGWLVAVGIGVILTALLSAAGAALAIGEESAETIGLVGAIGLFVIGLLSYFTGGYVAGRMSRFDGGRQGFGVWAWALIVAIILAIIGAIAGNEYNVFGTLDLPRIPIDEGTLTTGGVITLVVVALGTLLAAILGGKAGESYHRRIDRTGFERAGRAPAARRGAVREQRVRS